jgi:hypothetical protein
MALIKPSIYIFSEFSKHQQQAKKNLATREMFLWRKFIQGFYFVMRR